MQTILDSENYDITFCKTVLIEKFCFPIKIVKSSNSGKGSEGCLWWYDCDIGKTFLVRLCVEEDLVGRMALQGLMPSELYVVIDKDSDNDSCNGYIILKEDCKIQRSIN